MNEITICKKELKYTTNFSLFYVGSTISARSFPGRVRFRKRAIDVRKPSYLNASVAFLNSRLSGKRSCAEPKKKQRKTSCSMWRINLTLIADRALTLRNPSGASRSRVK